MQIFPSPAAKSRVLLYWFTAICGAWFRRASWRIVSAAASRVTFVPEDTPAGVHRTPASGRI